VDAVQDLVTSGLIVSSTAEIVDYSLAHEAGASSTS
jgi:hypothetical protein